MSKQTRASSCWQTPLSQGDVFQAVGHRDNFWLETELREVLVLIWKNGKLEILSYPCIRSHSPLKLCAGRKFSHT